MYIKLYNYTKSFWGRDIEIFNDDTKWGYVTWNGYFKSGAVGDLYGKKYLLSIASVFPLQYKVLDETKTEEIAKMSFNFWCTKAHLKINDGSDYHLKSIHHFSSKYIWEKDETQVMRIKNGFMGGEIESSVTDEKHNALLVIMALYINNHIASTIIIIVILLYLVFE